MKSFVIFAIVVTIIYVIYYTVIIVQDLYGKPKDEKSQGESFDVSDMTDEEESIAVSESDGVIQHICFKTQAPTTCHAGH